MRLVLPLLNSPTTTNKNKSSKCAISWRSSVKSLSRASLSISLSQILDSNVFSRSRNARNSGDRIKRSDVASPSAACGGGGDSNDDDDDDDDGDGGALGEGEALGEAAGVVGAR